MAINSAATDNLAGYVRVKVQSRYFYPLFPRHVSADVLKARLKTTGVAEHTFLINSGSYKGVPWRIYDVGGGREANGKLGLLTLMMVNFVTNSVGYPLMWLP